MKKTMAAIFVSLSLSVSAGHAQDPVRSPGEPYPVVLSEGETFPVCKSGQIVCPAIAPICDDPKVAVPVDTPDGLGFRGAGRGTTLCSAASTSGLRRVFRITVR